MHAARAVRGTSAEVVSIDETKRRANERAEFTRELMALIERIHEADAAQNYPPRARLLEHGAVGLEEAARLLGVAPRDLEADNRVGRARGKGGVLLFPLSELLRAHRRGRRFAVNSLIAEAERLIRSTTSVKNRFYDVISCREEAICTDVEIAERLGITRAAARRLLKDEDGPLFVEQSPHGRLSVTPEELEAYARKVGAPAAEVRQ